MCRKVCKNIKWWIITEWKTDEKLNNHWIRLIKVNNQWIGFLDLTTCIKSETKS